MINIKRKFKIIGIIVLVLVISIICLFVFSSRKNNAPPPTPLTIISSIPTNGATNISVFNPLTLTFNQKVDPSTITINSFPQENWIISQSAPNSIKIKHQLYLMVDTSYTLTISQNGSDIGILTFYTAKDQNDPRQLQVLESQLNKDYPLAKLTPYETSTFKVVYTAPLTFGITIKNSTPQDQILARIKSWVKANGIDPETHKYTFISPSSEP